MHIISIMIICKKKPYIYWKSEKSAKPGNIAWRMWKCLIEWPYGQKNKLLSIIHRLYLTKKPSTLSASEK